MRTRLLDDGGGADDDLLTPEEVADWFGVSTVWLDIGRQKNYGPAFVKLSDRVVRYRRGACRKYLKQRTFACVADYKAAAKRKTAVA